MGIQSCGTSWIKNWGSGAGKKSSEECRMECEKEPSCTHYTSWAEIGACALFCGECTLENHYYEDIVGETYEKLCDVIREPVDCQYEWQTSECVGECGDGIRTKVYKLLKDSENGGEACEFSAGTTVTEPCDPCSDAPTE